jgi:hypothetical protein
MFSKFDNFVLATQGKYGDCHTLIPKGKRICDPKHPGLTRGNFMSNNSEKEIFAYIFSAFVIFHRCHFSLPKVTNEILSYNQRVTMKFEILGSGSTGNCGL